MFVTMLRMSKYMWIIFYLLLKLVFSFIYIYIFTKAAYQLTLVGLAVAVRVPQFEKPCCNLKNVQMLEGLCLV